MSIIKTHDLTKTYGATTALKGLTLELNEGDMFGYIGPNGSGKTTTMRILATLLQPTWGEASVGGYSIYKNPKEIRRMIGYMPDFFGVYDDMKVIEYLEFFAAAYRIKGAARKKICNDVLELVDLGYKRDEFVTSLSRGMTQRLGLARVLLHDPKVLILDEPASGLDPRARIEIRSLLKELCKMGKTIMVSSHILPELADVCNKVGMIEKGVLVANATVAEVMRLVQPRTVLVIGVFDPPDAAAKVIEETKLTEKIEIRGDKIYVTLAETTIDYSVLSTMLIERGQKLMLFKEDEINLETAFMALTKGITS
jgi:ABC-2 type transport system ATP-binding protein